MEFENSLIIQIDNSAHAAHIKYSSREVAKTVFPDDETIVELDKSGLIVGVEHHNLSMLPEDLDDERLLWSGI